MHVTYDRGIYLPAIDCWLDPVARRERAVVSHAHSDHVRLHACTLTTPATARLIAHRYRRPGAFETAEFGARQEYSSFAITLLPAGHVLGAAQTLIEHRGSRLLYSGDFRLSDSLTAGAAETPEAEVLVMEATFGRPGYRFPPPAQVAEAIARFCREALDDGQVPVLFAYSLGKGQELLARLAPYGFDFAVHDATHGVCQIYDELGAGLPPSRRLNGGDGSGAVVIAPMQARRGPALAGVRRMRTAYISGWAVDRAARYRMGVDAAFCLSDHADYDELLSYVRRVNPQRVYTIYGFAGDLAADLRAAGYDATPLNQPMQQRLF